MSSISMSPRPVVQRWEDAHAHLLNAFTSYIDTCTDLKDSSVVDSTFRIGDLVPRIERHIASLHSVVVSQTFQTRALLSTIRNQLASPIYALPEGVLVEILTLVIYDLVGYHHHPGYQSVKQEVRSVYQRLHRLIGVCSSWQDIIAHTRNFWFIVPMIETHGSSRQLPGDAIERSLRRSRSTGLHVAINVKSHFPTLLMPLTDYANRIRTLSIQVDWTDGMRQVVSDLAILLVPGILSELSIYCRVDSGDHYTFNRHRVERQERLKQVMGSLRSLRLYNTRINVNELSLANLVELRLERIQFNDGPMFKRFLGKLSVASKLEHLHISGLIIPQSPFVQPGASQDDANDDTLSISFPNLKLVYIHGMPFHYLEALFNSIIPGGEEWIVSFSSYCMRHVEHGTESKASVQQLGQLLRGFNVNTLILTGWEYGDNWLDGSQLSQLLKTVPTVTTLKMDVWKFNQEDWEALERPQDPMIGINEFPCIQNFHIYNARIIGEHGIQSVVKSHKIQQLRLGGRFDGQDRGIENGDSITTWLVSNVADFQLIGYYVHPPKHLGQWRFW